MTYTLKWMDVVDVEHSETRQDGSQHHGTRQEIFNKWHDHVGPQWPCSLNGIRGHFTAVPNDKVRFVASP